MGVFSGWWRQRDVMNAVEQIIDTKLRESVTALMTVDELVERRTELELEVHRLGEEKADLQSSIERERLDIQHKLGLEKMRQQQDAEIAQERLTALREDVEREKEIAIREARLVAKEEAIGEARQQMREFLDRQESMIGQLLQAVPKAEIFHRQGGPDNVVVG